MGFWMTQRKFMGSSYFQETWYWSFDFFREWGGGGCLFHGTLVTMHVRETYHDKNITQIIMEFLDIKNRTVGPLPFRKMSLLIS